MSNEYRRNELITGEVRRSAKCPSGPGQDDRPHCVIGSRSGKCIEQFVAHPVGERIHAFRPVKGDGKKTIINVVEYLFVFHRRLQSKRLRQA